MSLAKERGRMSGSAGLIKPTRTKLQKKELTEIERLELENQKMEERLQAFRENLSRQKAKRASISGNSLWSGGDLGRGSLNSYAADVLQKKNESLKGKRYSGIGKQADEGIKAIKQAIQERTSILHASSNEHAALRSNPDIVYVEPIPPPLPNPKPTAAPAARLWRIPTPVLQNSSLATTTDPSDSALDHSIHGEVSTLRHEKQKREYVDPATVNLKTNHATLEKHVWFHEDVAIDRNSTGQQDRTELSELPIKHIQNSFSDEGIQSNPSDMMNSGALSNGAFDGEYDENASRASFLEALNEWRQQRKEDTAAHTNINSSKSTSQSKADLSERIDLKTPSHEGTSTENAGIKSYEQIKISVEKQIRSASEKLKQEDSFSYMDRLLLTRMREHAEKMKNESIIPKKPGLKDEYSHPLEHPKNDELQDHEDHSYSDDEEEIQSLLGKACPSSSFESPSGTATSSEKNVIQKATLSPSMLGLSITDVTDREEEEILSALDRGQIVEVIPPGKLIVIEP